jgi:RND family efflux transporter MFP subunit
MRDKRLWMALQGLLVVSAFMLVVQVAWAGPPGGMAVPPPVVVVEPASLRNVNPSKRYVGHVEAVQEVEIMPRVEGYLVEVNFKEGQYVRQGRLLYTIEQPPYLSRVKLWEARVAQAQAALYKADMRLKRLKAARPESVPATEMDNAIANKAMAQAQLQEAHAQLELARIDLGYTQIKAPISGLLGKTFFTKGNLVGSSKGPLARLVQLEPIRVVYSVSEGELIKLQKAMKKGKPPKIQIRLPNGEMCPERGTIEFMDNRVDPSTGTVALWALLDNRDHTLLPGEYVDVLMEREKAVKMVVIPQGAVLTDLVGHYVLVVDENHRVRQARVELGPQVGTLWAVKKGLSPGELIIVQGIQKVQLGQVVKAIIQGKDR